MSRLITLLDPISPQGLNRVRSLTALVVCGVAGYAIWIHATSVGPVVACVPERFVVFDPPRDRAISVRIGDQVAREAVHATGLALWSRGRASGPGSVRLVFDRPIVAIRELSNRPPTLSIDDRLAQNGELLISWNALAEAGGIALLVAHPRKGAANVRVDRALMTTLWAAAQNKNKETGILLGLAVFMSLFTCFAPTNNNPSCLFGVMIILVLALWGFVLIFIPGYVQRCPPNLLTAIHMKLPQPDWVQ